MSAAEQYLWDGIDPTVVETINGSGWTAAGSSFRSLEEDLARKLSRLDGDTTWSFALHLKPEEEYFPEMDILNGLPEYMQSAGTAEGMTIEVRRQESDGVLRQYALSNPASTDSSERVVTWPSKGDGESSSMAVRGHELFTASEAVPVYLYWANFRQAPAGYAMRLLDL